MHQEKEEVLAFAREAKAPNTKRAYQADWNDFAAFCRSRNNVSLPADPDVVALYLRHEAEKVKLKMTTVARRIAAITEKHRENGFVSPADQWVVRNTLKRLRRELGSPARGKAPLLTADLQKIVQIIPSTRAGTRDKAVLLLGFAGAMRRSELVGLDVADLALAPEGLVLSVNQSKTDQVHQGRKIGIPYGKIEATCPVQAVLRWLDESKISDGPLFRAVNKHGHVRMTRLTDQIIADIVKKYVGAIGKYTTKFSGHSLRAGFITSADMAGVPERAIQEQSGHRSILVLRRYIRDASIFRANAAGKVGL